MGLLDAFQKKKPMKKTVSPLEMPPPPEGQEAAPFSFPSLQPSPQVQERQPQLPTPTPMPTFSLPTEQEPFPSPASQMPPEAMQLSELSFDQQFPELAVPLPPEEEQKAIPEGRAAFPLEAPIRHPDAAFSTEKALEVPLEVSQELLSLPEAHRKEHPEFYKKEQMQEARTERKKQLVQHLLPKEYIPLSQLFEVGEQLMTLGEDLALAKDTTFRLTDLNEQEIEQMARWYAVQQSIDLRIAEIDKLLFKA